MIRALVTRRAAAAVMLTCCVAAAAGEPLADPPAAAVPIAPLDAVPLDAVPLDAAPPEDAPPEDAPPEDAPPEDAPPEDAPPEDAPPEDAPPEDAPPDSAKPLLLERAEATHTMFSIGLERWARNIDSFFGADQAFEEATRSYARVRLDTTLDEDLLSFNGDIRVRVDLPRTERKLKLLIESDSDEATAARPEETPVDVLRNQDYLLSIEHVDQYDTWDVRPAAGVKLRWTPDLFLRVRATRYQDLDGWLMRTAGGVFWFAADGYAANTVIDFDRAIGNDMLFRSASILRWDEETEYLTAEEQLSLFQRLDPRRYLVYRVGAIATRDPDWAMDEYFVAVHYRKNVYRNWLFFEIIPQINFHVEHDFDPQPNLTFRLEGVFGHDYL